VNFFAATALWRLGSSQVCWSEIAKLEGALVDRKVLPAFFSM
jgi:hypothetical protein